MDWTEFLHENQVFKIIYEDDLAFSEIREILDHLIAQNCFHEQVAQGGGAYQVNLEKSSFNVWVVGMEVIVQRSAYD